MRFHLTVFVAVTELAGEATAPGIGIPFIIHKCRMLFSTGKIFNFFENGLDFFGGRGDDGVEPADPKLAKSVVAECVELAVVALDHGEFRAAYNLNSFVFKLNFGGEVRILRIFAKSKLTLPPLAPSVEVAAVGDAGGVFKPACRLDYLLPVRQLHKTNHGSVGNHFAGVVAAA